ncbi:MAG: lipid-A-disaccharide synthase [Myxococcota bacterium]
MTSAVRAPTVLVSAGDASGDPYAAAVVRALRARRGDLHFAGLGGEAMRAAGVELAVHQREVAIGGLVEVAAGALRLARAWRALGRVVRRARPALALLVDTADWNLRLAGALARAGVPVLYYVLPQVWAWRSGRARVLARRCARLAVILPFERDVWRGHGVDVAFVGHPLVDEVASLDPGAGPALRRALGIAADARVVALLPGSRRNELAYQLPLQLAALRALASRVPRVEALLPVAPSLDAARVRARLARHAHGAPRVHVVERADGAPPASHAALAACDAVLAKPGTATLEAALLDRPIVVAGRGHALSAALARRLVRVDAWALPNLVDGSRFVPELLQEDARPEAIASALAPLLDASPEREAQRAGLRRVRDALGGGGAAERVADIAEDMLGAARA